MHKSLADQVLPQAVRDGLERLIGRHNMRRATRKGLCSERTQQHRRDIILLSVAQLWQDGFRLETAKALKEKHVEHLIERWDAEGLSPSMLHTRLSVLRTLSKWIHKQQVCKDLADYLPAERIKRSTVARTNLAWEGNGVELAAVLQTAYALNERFGLMLELQHQFGLRAKEVIQFRPAECYDNTLSALVVFEGTKGGRPRMIAVQTPAQKALIKRVVEMVGATCRIALTRPPFLFQVDQAIASDLTRCIQPAIWISKSDLIRTPRGLGLAKPNEPGGKRSAAGRCALPFPTRLMPSLPDR